MRAVMPLTHTWAALPALFPGLGPPESWLPQLQKHWALIEAAAPRVQVTTVSADDAPLRHFAEALELLAIIERQIPLDILVDVGSGGGFPGLVIACVRPDVQVHLVEPLRKRADLLSAIATQLGLHGVEVHAERAEDAGRGPLRDSASVVTARAVAALPQLIEYTAPFARPNGLVALPKGSGLDEELTHAGAAMTELSVDYAAIEAMRPEVSETGRVALFRKRGPTPAKYPRRAGMPAKRPL